MPTVCNDIHTALKGFDVRLVSVSSNGIEVVIGSCGRKMDKTRTFKAKSVETVVKQIKKNFD